MGKLGKSRLLRRKHPCCYTKMECGYQEAEQTVRWGVATKDPDGVAHHHTWAPQVTLQQMKHHSLLYSL